MKKTWWRLSVPSSHCSQPKKQHTHPLYIYASDAAAALNKAKKMNGWKKEYSFASFTPTVVRLFPDQAAALEKTIVQYIPLSIAKKFGFYGRRKDCLISL